MSRGPNNNTYGLPASCGDPLFEHQLYLESPGDDDLHVQFINGSGKIFYRVFGIPSGGGQPEELLACTGSNSLVNNERVQIARSYDHLVVSVTRDNVAIPFVDTTFIKVSAYDDLPTEGSGCTTPQRYVIGTCNPNAFVAGWAASQGFDVVNSLPFPELQNYVLVESSFPIETNGVPASLPEEIEQDTITYFIENDFTFSLPPSSTSPLTSTVGEQNYSLYNDLITNAFHTQCEDLQYRPEVASSNVSGTDTLIVAIVDSGVDPVHAATWNAHRYTGVNRPYLMTNSYGFDFITNTTNPIDSIGHGTGVAGVFLSGYRGQRPLALVHYKIFDANQGATYFGAVTAIYAAVVNGAEVINLSWGIPIEEPPQALTCAIDYAESRGVIVVTTAGNRTQNIDDIPQWPGAFARRDSFSNVITTNAYYRIGSSIELPNYSSWGPASVTLSAYGVANTAVMGTITGSTSMHGTSIAAPIVARHVATLRGNTPSNTPFPQATFYSMLQGSYPQLQTKEGGRLLPLGCPPPVRP